MTTGARAEKAKLNALPHFVTEIDRLDIHFVHVRSKHEDALPLIVAHGWPGSIIGRLEDRSAGSPIPRRTARARRTPSTW